MATDRKRLKSGRGIRRPGEQSALSRAIPWIALGLGLVLVWGAFELGQINAGHSRLAAIQRESALRSELLTSRQEVKALRERIAVLETGAKVSAEAYRQVEDQLAGLQARIQQQSEDIAFYRGIVGADQQAGLRVQNLEVVEAGEPGAYSLRMVLRSRRTRGRGSAGGQRAEPRLGGADQWAVQPAGFFFSLLPEPAGRVDNAARLRSCPCDYPASATRQES